ncbi:uncharacterized protein LOC128383609 [Scomber japonicus]|uniref:uncharacterized protein LOC128383609 n=1 Tax=Scomber japonicus TaxID=13676 RepID=UPI0023056878|nr:uncharacterized protein LOC128383609 [Scomber japonicus]
MVGDDVVLPCQLEPPADATPMIFEWAKPDLDPRFVFVWHNGQELVVDQNKAYKGRSSLFIDRLKHGDVSLKLSKVKISDEGTYRCYFPKLNKEYFVELLVGAVSSTGISLVGTDRSSSGVVLQCESKGWNPKPDVFWLNREGNLLSAGPTETIRGPDGLYTVSSRVTVEKRRSNNFTCRVQQDNINQTRETHIIIPDDFFIAPSSCAASITTSVLFSIMFILAVAIFIWKWRQYKPENKKQRNELHPLMEGEGNREQLLTESKKIEDLQLKINKQLQKKVEEKNDLEKLIDELTKQREEVVSQKEQINVNIEKADEMDKENRKKIDVLDKEINDKEGDKTANKAQGYLKLKEIISQANCIQDKKKYEQEKLIMYTDEQIQADIKFNRMIDKKQQSQSVMTMVGDDVVLPCQLEPPADAAPMILEWAKPDLKPRFVFVWRSGQELVMDQNKAYKGRTSLFIDKMNDGDVSLKLSKVKISDEGTYRCYFPKLKKIFFVELLVGAVSSPGISLVGTDRSSSVVVLQCESKGWNPQPEVFWLDDEGNLLSAGPTETIRGPDGLYTVSSRVTVEKKYGNNFTCRVQQDNINQFRETHIIIPDDFFMAPSSCAASITTSVLFSVMFILAVAIFIWKWRQYKTENKKQSNELHPLMEGEGNREQLLTESKKTEDLQLKLNKQLQKKEEEKNDLEKLIDELMKQKDELRSQKEQIIVNMEKTDEMDKENKKKIDVVDKEIIDKEGDKTANKAQGYLKLKELISQVNYIQDKRKHEQDNLIMNTNEQRNIDIIFNRMTDKKKQVENNIEEINEQLETINRQREEIQKKLESEEKGK